MSRMPSIVGESPLEISEVAHNLSDAPQLLIQWSSPWQEFVTAIRPALTRSPKRLAGEAPVGMFPAKGMLAGWILEALLLVAAVVLPGKFVGVQPFTPLPKPKYDVIYFSGKELPQTSDAGGAQTGKSGRAGGHEGFHPTQTIKVARGDSPTEKVVDAPKLNLPKSDQPVANLLAIKTVPGPPPASGLRSSLPALPAVTPIAPPPQVSRDKLNSALTLNSGVIAPAPQVTREKMQSVPALATQVVAPPPSVQRDAAGVRLPQVGTEIIPPPISAPVSTTSIASRLSLPQPGVIAPPPSNVTHDVSSFPGGTGADFSQSIVPPPVEVNGQFSNRQQAGSLSGTSTIVPPPVQVDGTLSGNRGTGSLSLANGIVPPPVEVGGTVSGNRGTGSMSVASGVVPPPPSLSGGSSLSGRGRGGSGAGLGGALDVGSVAAPPRNAAGNGDKAGVVISSQPGSRVGVPGSGGAGSLSMSPAGSKPGVGGSGGGSGIGRGTGPGSGLEGTGSGAGKTGAGRGAELSAKGGISPYPGAGGAGTGRGGASPAPGIAVSGGGTITLPSFGADGNANVPGHSGALAGKHGPGITIEATSRSGGAFGLYGVLKGDKVYTIYIETALGTAVLQYADPSSASHSYRQELAAPEPLRADVPAGIARSRVVIACVLDRAGILRNLHILEPGSAEMDSRILAALPAWKFRPAQRGDQPVEVNAILGFNIDTR